MRRWIAAGAFALAVALGACQPTGKAGGGAASVDQVRIENADSEPGNWLSHGRTYSEQRYSPLAKIDTTNVGKLGLAWTYETRERRAAEATPIVVDGIMYVTSAWSSVYALNAKTGKELWVFDPEIDRTVGALACCDVANRGVAVWKGKLYLGAIDGRLIAINAKDGTKAWEVQTTDRTKPYTITGAPRVAKGLVFIGNGGAEYGVRGYVSAYDAETGKLKWRFYTVPGDPSKGPDNAASDPQMAIAARTWTGRFWRIGGGGTVWDAIVFDDELDQLYIGVGNGSPWDRQVRSPGGGDNLFLSSIVALKPETGEYIWHFQETPGETWDFTATQPIILATLKIGGAERKVLMQAPKNGFFYVIDRTSGRFISGRNFVPMAKEADTPKGMPISWAYGLDANGRPLENPSSRYPGGKVRVTPTGRGAHNWNPMSFSPQTGLVYLPVQQTYGDYERVAKFTVREGFSNIGITTSPRPGAPPPSPELTAFNQSWLAAWDPLAQKEVWRAPRHAFKNGGTLATAGGLVFWGQGDGRFEAFDARTGKVLWSVDNGLAMVSGPISYAVDGEQYVAVMTGAALAGRPPRTAGHMPQSRVTVFRLGGTAKLPANPPAAPLPRPPTIKASPAVVARGEALYGEVCYRCHGPGGSYSGVMPDLRASPLIHDAELFRGVVMGERKTLGMPDFSKWMSAADVEAVRAYVAARAQLAYAAEQEVATTAGGAEH